MDFRLAYRSCTEQRNDHVALPNRCSSGIVLGGICVSAFPIAPDVHQKKSITQIAVTPSGWVPEWEPCKADLNLAYSLEVSPAELG